MTRRAAKPIIAAVLALLLALLSDCAMLGDKLSGLTEPTEEPLDETVTAAPSAEAPQSEAVNPVFALVSDFISAYREASSGLFDSVLALHDEQAAALYSKLQSCEAELALLYATVGMLPPGDGTGSPFSGEVQGANPGHGELKANGDFTFSFDSGSVITGSADESSLSAVISSSGEKPGIALSRVSGGFLAVVGSGSDHCVLELTAGGLRFVRGLKGPISTDDGFPAGAGPTLSYFDAKAQIAE